MPKTKPMTTYELLDALFNNISPRNQEIVDSWPEDVLWVDGRFKNTGRPVVGEGKGKPILRKSKYDKTDPQIIEAAKQWCLEHGKDNLVPRLVRCLRNKPDVVEELEDDDAILTYLYVMYCTPGCTNAGTNIKLSKNDLEGATKGPILNNHDCELGHWGRYATAVEYLEKGKTYKELMDERNPGDRYLSDHINWDLILEALIKYGKERRIQ